MVTLGWTVECWGLSLTQSVLSKSRLNGIRIIQPSSLHGDTCKMTSASLSFLELWFPANAYSTTRGAKILSLDI